MKTTTKQKVINSTKSRSFFADDETWNKAQRLASEDGRSISGYLRNAINREFKRRFKFFVGVGNKNSTVEGRVKTDRH